MRANWLESAGPELGLGYRTFFPIFCHLHFTGISRSGFLSPVYSGLLGDVPLESLSYWFHNGMVGFEPTTLWSEAKCSITDSSLRIHRYILSIMLKQFCQFWILERAINSSAQVRNEEVGSNLEDSKKMLSSRRSNRRIRLRRRIFSQQEELLLYFLH